MAYQLHSYLYLPPFPAPSFPVGVSGRLLKAAKRIEFEKRKTATMASLGSTDTKITQGKLGYSLNSHPSYFTTSSCTGRNIPLDMFMLHDHQKHAVVIVYLLNGSTLLGNPSRSFSFGTTFSEPMIIRLHPLISSEVISGHSGNTEKLATHPIEELEKENPIHFIWSDPDLDDFHFRP
ncbi:hypothetical protein SDJN03_04385, partial [Cucurbita argyrosperma subsp. sororia]